MPEQQTPAAAGFSSEAARMMARVTAVGLAVVVIAGAVLSYDGLHATSVRAGARPALAWVYPVSVDGLILVGLASVVYATLAGMPRRLPWSLVIIGTAASVGGNIAAHIPTLPVWVLLLWVALPPVSMALALEQLVLIYRHRATLPPPRPRKTRRMVSVSPSTSVDRDPTVAPAAQAVTASASREPSKPRSSAPSPTSAPRPQAGMPGTRLTSLEALVLDALTTDPTLTDTALARRISRDRSNSRRARLRLIAKGLLPDRDAAAAESRSLAGDGDDAVWLGQTDTEPRGDTRPLVAVTGDAR